MEVLVSLLVLKFASGQVENSPELPSRTTGGKPLLRLSSMD
jgi:hypothetical protein